MKSETAVNQALAALAEEHMRWVEVLVEKPARKRHALKKGSWSRVFGL